MAEKMDRALCSSSFYEDGWPSRGPSETTIKPGTKASARLRTMPAVTCHRRMSSLPSIQSHPLPSPPSHVRPQAVARTRTSSSALLRAEL